jgi:hypothetical protein
MVSSGVGILSEKKKCREPSGMQERLSVFIRVIVMVVCISKILLSHIPDLSALSVYHTYVLCLDLKRKKSKSHSPNFLNQDSLMWI